MIKSVFLFLVFLLALPSFAEEKDDLLKKIDLKMSDVFFRYRYHIDKITPYSDKNNQVSGGTLLPKFQFSKKGDGGEKGKGKIILTPLITYRGSDQSENEAFEVGEAYFHYMYGENFKLNFILGKQELHFREGNLFSRNRDLNKPLFYDSLNFSLSYLETIKSSLIFLNKRNNDIGYVSSPKEFALGMVNQFNFSKFKFDFYYIYHENDNTINLLKQYSLRDNKYKNSHIYGAYFNHSFEFFLPFTYHLEFIETAFNRGGDEKRHLEIYQAKGQFIEGKFGFNLSSKLSNSLKEINDFRTTFHYFLATKFYTNTFGDKGTSLGLGRMFGRKNIQGIGINQKVGFNNGYQFYFEYYKYSAEKEKFPIYRPDGREYVSSKTSSGGTDLGHEIALKFEYSLLSEVKIGTTLYRFTPGGMMKDYYGNEALLGTTLELAYEF